MLYRIYCIIFVLVFALVACVGNGQTVTSQAQDTTITIAPTSINTLTFAPSVTLIPNATMTATASITPKPTSTPWNFALADSGYDFANVEVSFPEPDRVFISFDYRIDKYDMEQIGIGLSLPSICPDFRNTPYPETNFLVPRGLLMGMGHVEYKIKSQGECNVPFFYLVIYSPFNNGEWPTPDQAVYQERIDQPIKIAKNQPPLNSKTLTVKNFSYLTTGSWSGRFTFDYSFSPEIADFIGKVQFWLRGHSGVLYCDLAARGPFIKELEGQYEINIDLRKALPREANGINCVSNLDNYSILTYKQLSLSAHNGDYIQYIDFTITFKK